MTSQKEAIVKRFKDRQQKSIRERADRNEKYRLEHSKDYQPCQEGFIPDKR